MADEAAMQQDAPGPSAALPTAPSTPRRSVQREPPEMETPDSKRRRREELIASSVSIDVSLDYSCLAGLPNIAGKSEYGPAQVAVGKAEGLQVLEHHHVFRPITYTEAKGMKRVDTTWVITQSRDLKAQGKVKCRITGRDYKWQSPVREDVYAPKSQPCSNPALVYYIMKMDNNPDDPMVVC